MTECTEVAQFGQHVLNGFWQQMQGVLLGSWQQVQGVLLGSQQ